ncbi:MAG: ATP-binding protein [Methermicoccaceae archaeon]
MGELLGRVCTFDGEGFTFIAPRAVASGTFVSYTENGDKVLCRVQECTPYRQMPQELLSDPTVSPQEVCELLGIAPEDYALVLARARVVGAFERELKEFVNPLRMPQQGTAIEAADASTLRLVSKVGDGDGSAFVGCVLGTDVPVHLSVREIASQHLAVLASTGSGKSYTVGVLIEEMMMPKNCGSVLVFDPHGEYSGSLTEMVDINEFVGDGYRPSVLVVRPEQVKVRASDLEPADFLAMMDDGNLSEKMREFFGNAYKSARNEARAREKERGLAPTGMFTLNDLEEQIELQRERGESTVDALLWRFGRLKARRIITDYEGIPLSHYFEAGKLTVMDVSGIGEGFQQLVAAVLLRLLFDARRGTLLGEYEEGDERYIPTPAFVVLEEAHRFTPAEGYAPSKRILKRILAEGRKFGVGVCLVSQRPSKLDADALSQCMSQITLKLVNPSDQHYVSHTVESFSRDIIEHLPSLHKGVAIISGVCINAPTLVMIRRRMCEGAVGSSIDAPRQWKMAAGERKTPRVIVRPPLDEELGV